MGMAEHEHVAGVARKHEIRGGAPQLVSVADVKRQPSDRQRSFTGEERIARIVDVAVDGLGGRDPAQRLEHAAPADVAGMHDQIDGVERLRNLGPHEPVRVRDQSDHIY